MKATLLCAIILALSSFVPARGNESQMCEGNPLMEVEGGVWVCASDPIIYGTMCELDCTDPHSIPEGDYEVFCTPEGWFPDPAQTENPPICVSHPCDPLPNTTYGEWECHHVKGVEGEVCTLNCDDFYDPETANTTVCAASQWHPDPTAMSCITCKVPSPPSHGHWNCQDFDDIPSYNYTARVCAVHCDVGYTHAGNNITICSMTGENTWSPEPQLSICQEIIPECEAPDLPPHGRWECDDAMQSCLMACEDGFAPGHEVEIGCGLEGDWCSADMGFACQPACEDLPALVENGTWSCEEREPPYLECFLNCDNGSMMIGDGIVSCGLGQLWTGEDDNCTESVRIFYKWTSNYELIWRDSGSGGDHDVSIWRPILESGYCLLGDVAVGSYGTPSTPALLVKISDAVTTPTGFTQKWRDSGSGADWDGSLWAMDAPSGFTCLGGAAKRDYNPPDRNQFCCVTNKYVVNGNLQWTWNDHGSGASRDGSVWTVVKGSDASGLEGGNFLPGNGNAKPPGGYLLNGDSVTVIEE